MSHNGTAARRQCSEIRWPSRTEPTQYIRARAAVFSNEAHAMYTYNLAYRHANGEIEGFTGTGTNREAAEMDARRKVRTKVQAIRETFCPGAVFVSHDGLTQADLDLLEADWRISARCRNM